MKKYNLYAYNDCDEKLLVYSSASLEQIVSVACALYTASELEFKVIDSTLHDCAVVSFVKPRE